MLDMILDPAFEWLEDMAFNDYSQFGEDGVFQAIFSAIGAPNEWCFECGASDGLFFSNTRRLLERGWSGVLVEGDVDSYARLLKNSAEFGERAKCLNLLVDSVHRIDGILEAAGAPIDIDLVVIDVDGQDYFLLNSIMRYRPKVIMVEFDKNADPDFIPPLGMGRPGQAGWMAIQKLGAGKFYNLVYSNVCNAVFVRHEFAPHLRKRKIVK
jgi:hypothetical protein